MDKYKQQALEAWSRWQALSPSRKTGWITVAAFFLAAAGFFWWVAQPQYRALYVGLSAEEAGAITAKLQAKGVAYKIGADGTTILVPADKAAQVYLDLANEGVTGANKLGKGLETFDQPVFGATPFDRHVNFVRGQQTEIARMIMQIDPIIHARVQIARPEPSPFIREQKPTTASVMVKLRPGTTLNRTTASGIASLVAASVEGLTKDNVRLMDASGRILSETTDPDIGMNGSILDVQKDVERHLAAEAERLLASVLGPGRAIVRVTVELSTKLMHEKKEIINVEGKALQKEKIQVKKMTSTGPSKGSTPGIGPNVGKAGVGPESGSKTNQEDAENVYLYPGGVIEYKTKRTTIDRLTVAAFVDTSGPEGKELKINLADVQEMIKKAVGFKMDRDEIQVTNVSMAGSDSSGFDAEYAAQQGWENILNVVRNVSIGMVALCTVVIAGVVIRRKLTSVAAPANAGAAPSKLQRVTDELDRNPEVLAEILSRWIDRAEASERKAA